MDAVARLPEDKRRAIEREDQILADNARIARESRLNAREAAKRKAIIHEEALLDHDALDLEKRFLELDAKRRRTTDAPLLVQANCAPTQGGLIPAKERVLVEGTGTARPVDRDSSNNSPLPSTPRRPRTEEELVQSLTKDGCTLRPVLTRIATPTEKPNKGKTLRKGSKTDAGTSQPVPSSSSITEAELEALKIKVIREGTPKKIREFCVIAPRSKTPDNRRKTPTAEGRHRSRSTGQTPRQRELFGPEDEEALLRDPPAAASTTPSSQSGSRRPATRSRSRVHRISTDDELEILTGPNDAEDLLKAKLPVYQKQLKEVYIEEIRLEVAPHAECSSNAFYDLSINFSPTANIKIDEVASDGKFIRLINKSEEEEVFLSAWSLVHETPKDRTVYKFHRGIKVAPGGTLCLFFLDMGQKHEPPSTLVMDKQRWYTDHEMVTRLYDEKEMEIAKQESKQEQLNTSQLRRKSRSTHN
ncbi:lamin-like protein [Daphnia pulex]|uniref:Lamin-like protein n=1 Tax=Daphnia pulex TaxID=6669 RepID=E9H5Y8_DAPPU|nr:lamin-like protein [Daphnia pulex]|eukprot:EFX72804.1 lamin-like protein [Daphnia pulex]